MREDPSPLLPEHWRTSRYELALDRPRVMGIVNVTPDSFSDGGRHASTTAALAHCEQLLRDGADILDIGGESTRPGSPPVSLEEELARVLPVLREAVRLGVPVSLDSYKPQVMRAALDLGVDIINDIWALRQPGALEVVAAHPCCGVCLMHMHRDPQHMQLQPMEGDVVAEVRDFLASRSRAVMDAGLDRSRIVLDVGPGFGKTAAHNFTLLQRQQELLALGFHCLAAWSRKSFLGAVTGLSVEQRLVPSLAAAVLALERGARVLRVHDVAQTVAAVAVWRAVQSPQELAD
jgi:dihydropteroate synthase